MPVYIYTARDTGGRVIQGNQEAASEVAAISILQGRNLYVTQIVNSNVVIKAKAATKKKRHNKIKSEDLLFFIAQTANLLVVGIPFVRTLEVIADQIESEQLYKVILEIVSNVKAGSTFKDAMARHPKIFPFYWAFLVEAGELSGTLPMVLSQLAKSLEASQALKKKIASALVYPSILVSAAVGAIVFFMMFIVPIFVKLFETFKAELPPLTKTVIAISLFLKNYSFLLAGGIFGGVYFFKKFIATPKGRRILHAVLLNLPLFGEAISDIVHARMCMILALLIRSGLSFLKSLEVTANVSGNYIFETAINNTRLDVQQGKSLSASLADSPIFSPMLVNLVKIGEESGKLPDMVDKAGEYFQQRVDVFATRIGIIIEPIVMVLVGGIIGVIAMSLFMPIIKLTSAVG
jgi:type IV pilus assembly protein PilC